MVVAVHGELASHLRGHEGVGDVLLVEVVVQVGQVQAYVVADDNDGGACCEGRIHVHHAGVKAVAGIGGHLVAWTQVVVVPVPMTEGHEVAVLELAALGLAGGA